MSRLILQMQASADGFVEAADPSAAWQLWDWGQPWPWDRELRRDFNETFRRVDRILLSRKLAEQGYIAHWARVSEQHPDDPDYSFARAIKNATKVVFSTRESLDLPWPRTGMATGGLTDGVSDLKSGHGADMIAFGGTGFAAALAAAGLVDEYQLFLNPTAVGRGESPFRSVAGGLRLHLIDSKPYACGMVVNRYTPEESSST